MVDTGDLFPPGLGKQRPGWFSKGNPGLFEGKLGEIL